MSLQTTRRCYNHCWRYYEAYHKKTLTPQQVEQLIVKPIHRANRDHVAIDYPEVKQLMEAKIGHSISARSIRRYGHDIGGIQMSSTIPRTEQESNIIRI